MAGTAQQPLPDLSPADSALLAALFTPPHDTHGSHGTHQSHQSHQSPEPHASLPDLLTLARFLSRPDIQPWLEALQALRALRSEIERDHLTRQTAEALLEVARTTDDLVEKRLAATAVIRLLSPPRSPRPAPSPALFPVPPDGARSTSSLASRGGAGQTSETGARSEGHQAGRPDELLTSAPPIGHPKPHALRPDLNPGSATDAPRPVAPRGEVESPDRASPTAPPQSDAPLADAPLPDASFADAPLPPEPTKPRAVSSSLARRLADADRVRREHIRKLHLTPAPLDSS